MRIAEELNAFLRRGKLTAYPSKRRKKIAEKIAALQI